MTRDTTTPPLFATSGNGRVPAKRARTGPAPLNYREQYAAMHPDRTFAEKPGDGGIRPGIAQASDHAERDCPGWNADALAFLRAYAASHGEFIAEAVVAAHKAAGHPEPPTTRAWGGVVQGAAHRGEIVEVGFAPRSNGSPCKVWKKNGTA